jgi:hypothetical protein
VTDELNMPAIAPLPLAPLPLAAKRFISGAWRWISASVARVKLPGDLTISNSPAHKGQGEWANHAR